MNVPTNRRPLIAAGTALGIGIGGFVDGIVLHQLLQVHNMLSAKYPTRGLPPEELIVNLQINMFWDGLFHVLTWTMTAAGVALLWNAARQKNVQLSTQTLWGLYCSAGDSSTSSKGSSIIISCTSITSPKPPIT
jgi:uncharacterized membrane protein